MKNNSPQLGGTHQFFLGLGKQPAFHKKRRGEMKCTTIRRHCFFKIVEKFEHNRVKNSCDRPAGFHQQFSLLLANFFRLHHPFFPEVTHMSKDTRLSLPQHCKWCDVWQWWWCNLPPFTNNTRWLCSFVAARKDATFETVSNSYCCLDEAMLPSDCIFCMRSGSSSSRHCRIVLCFKLIHVAALNCFSVQCSSAQWLVTNIAIHEIQPCYTAEKGD